MANLSPRDGHCQNKAPSVVDGVLEAQKQRSVAARTRSKMVSSPLELHICEEMDKGDNSGAAGGIHGGGRQRGLYRDGFDMTGDRGANADVGKSSFGEFHLWQELRNP